MYTTCKHVACVVQRSAVLADTDIRLVVRTQLASVPLESLCVEMFSGKRCLVNAA